MSMFETIAQDNPSYYMAVKMLKELGTTLIFNTKREHPRVIGKHRKGSWVEKCVEWDNYYKTIPQLKGKVLKVIRHKHLKLPEAV